MENAQAQRSRPLRVLVATPLGEGGRGGIDRIMDELRAEDRRHPDADIVVDFVVTRGQGSIALAPFYLMRAILAVARRPDVLHINLSSHGSALRKIVLACAARMFRVPYVIHLHGSRFRQYWQQAPKSIRGRIDSLFRHAARIAVLGGVWRDFVKTRVPEAQMRLRVLPNATRAPEPFEKQLNPEPVVLFLGRLGARKGVPDLVAALSMIAQRHPALAWKAMIAGDGEIEETKRAIGAAGLADKVSVPGWVSPSDVDRLLRQSDILVLPSYDENLPMSVIEGMAYGLAVVTTPVGAVEDIIRHNETGLLVPPGDIHALADALERVISHEDLRGQLGMAARDFHARSLDISPYLKACRALWCDAAQARS